MCEKWLCVIEKDQHLKARKLVLKCGDRMEVAAMRRMWCLLYNLLSLILKVLHEKSLQLVEMVSDDGMEMRIEVKVQVLVVSEQH